jgi:flagellar biogenesis protein FliO
MRGYLVSVLGETGASVAQVIITFIAILAILAVVVWVLRSFVGNRFTLGGGQPRAPRLGVIDSIPVDAKRRLVLVRRDQFEHLLLVGGPTDIVVEETIYRGVPLANYPRNENGRVAQPMPQGQASLRGAQAGELQQSGSAPEAPALSQPIAAAPAQEPAPPTAQPTPPRAASASAAAANDTPAGDRSTPTPFPGPAANGRIEPHSAVEPHGEVPFIPVDRQSRAASFASRFQSGFNRGLRRPLAANGAAEPIQSAAAAAIAAELTPPSASETAGRAASQPETRTSPANGTRPVAVETSDSDWIKPAFADALEPRQAQSTEPAASDEILVNQVPSEEGSSEAEPVAEEPPSPPPPVEFSARAASRRPTHANLEQEMARLLGEIASKRSR